MRGIEEIRRENLIAQSDRLGGDSKLSRALGYDDENRVYQWLRADGEQRRNPRSSTIREFEKRLGLAPGELDVDHSAPKVSPVAQDANDVTALQIVVRELTRSLVANAPGAARDFAALLLDVAEKKRFATDTGLVGEALRIVELGQHNAASAIQRALQTSSDRQSKPEKRGRSRQA